MNWLKKKSHSSDHDVKSRSKKMNTVWFVNDVALKALILKVFFLFGLLLVPGFYQFHFKKVDAYHDLISGFRMLWIFITGQQRCLNDLCNGTVCLPGHASWIHFSQSLQKFWRRKVEIKCPSDFNAVSRHCICSFLCY